jgi:hypothetical protein
MRGVVLALLLVASVAALAGIGDGFGGIGDNGGFAGAAGLGQPKRPGAALPSPTFDLIAGATTPNDLSDSLTVNSTSMTLVLACDAQGISGTSWTCRNSSGNITLSEAGTGSSPSTTTLSPFHSHDAAERQTTYGTTQKRHDAASSTVADLTTDDFAVEYVGKLSATSGAVVIDKGLAGTDGWRLAQSTTAAMQLQLRTASVTASVVGATGQTSAWTHFLAFVDRSEVSTNGALAYGNGAPGTGVDFSARSATATNASTLAIGAASASSSNATTVSSIRVWRCSACFAGGATNPTQWAPIARQRAATAFGVAPNIAAGTAAPTALTRATTGHVDVVDGSTRQLYLTGNAAPRVARRTYSGGTVVAGYMNEPAVSNIALQSQTLGTTWAAITAGDNVLADAWAGADLTTTGDNIDGANSAAEHGLRQSITLTAASHTFSAWAKAGSQSLVALRNATIANGTAWFDLSACAACTIGENCAAAVKTTQAGVLRASADRWPVDTTGDGVADVSLCRVSITYTGTVAAHNHDLLCAPSDGVTSYTDADATADCGFWGVRVEAFPVATSYLATTTAATARNADDVRFDGASHYTGSPSTMNVAVLCPTHDTDTARVFASVGTSGTSYSGMRVAGTDFAEGIGVVTSTQWQITAASGDVSDGVLHNLRQTTETNNVQAYFDGTSIGTDTVATLPPAASSFLYLGTQAGTATQTGCLLSRVRLWSSLVTPAVVP